MTTRPSARILRSAGRSMPRARSTISPRVSQALKAGPDYPLNNLLLGDALVAAEKFDEAKKQYRVVLDAQPKPEDAHFLPKWKKLAQKGMDDAEKKKSSAMNPSS